MITGQQLAEIEDRLRRATPGEWVFISAYDCRDNAGNRLPYGCYVYAPNVIEPYPGLNAARQRAVMNSAHGRLVAEIHSLEQGMPDALGIPGPHGGADGEFIAHARRDVEMLLAEVRRLRTLLEKS